MNTLRSQLRADCEHAAALAARLRNDAHELLLSMDAGECEHALSDIEGRVADARCALANTTTTTKQLARARAALHSAIEVVTWELAK